MKNLGSKICLLVIIVILLLGSGLLVAKVRLKNNASKQEGSFNQSVGSEKAVEMVPKDIAPKVVKSDNLSDSNQDSFLFAVIGDTQRFNSGPVGNFQKAVASIRKLNPDLVFVVGDLIGSCNGGSKCEKEYAKWKGVVGDLIGKTYAVQGNHDRNKSDKSDTVWQSSFNFPTNGPTGFSELTYSLDFGNSHFIFLDSEKPKEGIVNNEQRDWLENDLATNKKENVFVVFHEPAFPVSSKIKESLDKNSEDRDTLWKIFDKYNVTAVFNGHEHIVSRIKIDSSVLPGLKNAIYQFVFANTDSFDHDLPEKGIAEYANQGQGCFGIVKVKAKEITVEVYDSDGSILDSFTF
jgi:3',5'-cyclic AMP phosphodiesterase CpdA